MVGYQALGWGLSGLLAPAWLCSNILGVACTPAVAAALRGLSLGNLCLAGRFFGGSDSDAAATGVVWFSAWYLALKSAGSVCASAASTATCTPPTHTRGRVRPPPAAPAGRRRLGPVRPASARRALRARAPLSRPHRPGRLPPQTPGTCPRSSSSRPSWPSSPAGATAARTTR